MTPDEMKKIVDNVAFSMEVEGFSIPEDQKDEWAKILGGEVQFDEVLNKYIAEAKLAGELKKSEASATKHGWLTIEEVEAAFEEPDMTFKE